MIKKVILFGKMPPPIGGVTRSVENLFNALKSKNIDVEIFSKQSLWKIRRFDIAHIHYSKSWKRFLGLIVGKLLAKKVVFTLHGRFYKKDFFNWLSSKFYNGVIFLNSEAYKEYKNNFQSASLIGSMFKEGFKLQDRENKKYFEKDNKYKYLLIYSHSKIIENDYDVYGIDFILNNIEKFPLKCRVVLVDPTDSYDVSIYKDRVIHLNKEVDFKSLLKEVDVYIRPTIKDGDSVAVQEALMMNVPVIASDIVNRPAGTILFRLHDINDFLEKLENKNTHKVIFEPNSIEKYIKFSNELEHE